MSRSKKKNCGTEMLVRVIRIEKHIHRNRRRKGGDRGETEGRQGGKVRCRMYERVSGLGREEEADGK